jgi:hypothetical protein
LQTVQRAVTADANQSFDAKLFQARRDKVEIVFFVRVNKIARRANECAAFRRFEFGNILIQRIQMHVRHARIEQAVETFDEADDLDLELVGARDHAVDRGVERGRVAAGGEDSDAFHKLFFLVGKTGLAESWQKTAADDGGVAENFFPSAKIFGQQANLIFVA